MHPTKTKTNDQLYGSSLEHLSEINARRWAFEIRPRGSGPTAGSDQIIPAAEEIFAAFEGTGLFFEFEIKFLRNI